MSLSECPSDSFNPEADMDAPFLDGESLNFEWTYLGCSPSGVVDSIPDSHAVDYSQAVGGKRPLPIRESDASGGKASRSS